MSDDSQKQEKVYTAKEVSTLLGIQNTTVRKYAQMLEKAGYHIHKNELGHRGFFNNDVIVLRQIRELIKHPDMSLDQAINVVISTVDTGDMSDRDTRNLVTYQETQQYDQLLTKFE
ncbi:MerR family transcriptional regulator, partial [Priestia aryabhattai]